MVVRIYSSSCVQMTPLYPSQLYLWSASVLCLEPRTTLPHLSFCMKIVLNLHQVKTWSTSQTSSTLFSFATISIRWIQKSWISEKIKLILGTYITILFHSKWLFFAYNFEIYYVFEEPLLSDKKSSAFYSQIQCHQSPVR